MFGGIHHVGLLLTSEQIITMAPDTSSATAGKKLGSLKHWRNLGQNSLALWGECQGSALYQVRVELSSLTLHCSCPSRKLPCKHSLGLLLIAATFPTNIPVTEPPEWVSTWLAKRTATSKRKEKSEAQPASPTGKPSAAQLKNAEKRLLLVQQGIERLDLWLNDLIRNGLASVETKPMTFWENQKAQMQDAQAPGLALRIQRLAAIPHASADWPAKLLAQLGLLALLTQAFHRLSQLDASLQEDVRQLVGWTLKEEEVAQRGERMNDEWLTLGQLVEEGERGFTQRIWLLGLSSQRAALLSQFALNRASFPQLYLLGVQQRATLVYWPSASPCRALLEMREGEAVPLRRRFAAFKTLEDFLADVSACLARQPWQDRFLCTLQDAIPTYISDRWWLCDRTGHALPLGGEAHWRLLALAGGMPIDFAGEWDGEKLTPLGMLVDERYYTL